jgi:hypothetical protein
MIKISKGKDIKWKDIKLVGNEKVIYKKKK